MLRVGDRRRIHFKVMATELVCSELWWEANFPGRPMQVGEEFAANGRTWRVLSIVDAEAQCGPALYKPILTLADQAVE